MTMNLRAMAAWVAVIGGLVGLASAAGEAGGIRWRLETGDAAGGTRVVWERTGSSAGDSAGGTADMSPNASGRAEALGESDASRRVSGSGRSGASADGVAGKTDQGMVEVGEPSMDSSAWASAGSSVIRIDGAIPIELPAGVDRGIAPLLPADGRVLAAALAGMGGTDGMTAAAGVPGVWRDTVQPGLFRAVALPTVRPTPVYRRSVVLSAMLVGVAMLGAYLSAGRWGWIAASGAAGAGSLAMLLLLGLAPAQQPAKATVAFAGQGGAWVVEWSFVSTYRGGVQAVDLPQGTWPVVPTAVSSDGSTVVRVRADGSAEFRFGVPAGGAFAVASARFVPGRTPPTAFSRPDQMSASLARHLSPGGRVLGTEDDGRVRTVWIDPPGSGEVAR